MAVMYRRPVGNTDIDNDPAPTGKMWGRFPERQVTLERRANLPQSPEVLQRLQALPHLTQAFFP